MKKKSIIVSLIAICVLLICPIRHVSEQGTRGIRLPWFSNCKTEFGCKYIDSIIWNYSDRIISSERIIADNSVNETILYTREKTLKLCNSIKLWSCKKTYTWDQGVFCEWNENEDLSARESFINLRFINVSVSESVFIQKTGKQKVIIYAEPINGYQTNGIKIYNSQNDTSVTLKEQEEGCFQGVIEIDTDVEIDEEKTMEIITISSLLETSKVETEIYIVKPEFYNYIYVGKHLSEYTSSDEYVKATNMLRREILLGIMEDMEKNGIVEKGSYSITGTTLNYVVNGINISLDFGENGIRPYEFDS